MGKEGGASRQRSGSIASKLRGRSADGGGGGGSSSKKKKRKKKKAKSDKEPRSPPLALNPFDDEFDDDSGDTALTRSADDATTTTSSSETEAEWRPRRSPSPSPRHRRTSSLSTHRQGSPKNKSSLRFAPDAREEMSARISNDDESIEDFQRSLLRLNSFRQVSPSVTPAPSRRVSAPVRSQSLDSVPNVPNTQTPRENSDETSEDDSVGVAPLSPLSCKKDFTLRRVYLSLLTQTDTMRSEIKEMRLDVLRHQDNLAAMTRAMKRQATFSGQLPNYDKQIINMISETSRGAVYGSYNFHDMAPPLIRPPSAKPETSWFSGIFGDGDEEAGHRRHYGERRGLLQNQLGDTYEEDDAETDYAAESSMSGFFRELFCSCT